jgi:hypothetical protein
MFAETRSDVPRVVSTLMDDSLIRDQGVCVREYIPLRRLDTGINGLPISNEWRLFFLGQNLLSYGYYWSNFEDTKPYDELPKEAFDLIDQITPIISKNVNFYVVDIAETRSGEWIVIELNDGQMSGISMIDPWELYSNLWEDSATFNPVGG